MAWWTGQPVYGSNPVSKFIRENFAYLKTYVDYIVNSGVTTADLAAVHATPPTLAAIVNITVNTTIGDADVGLGGGYNISGGVSLTINGAFSAPLTQVFFGAGTVVFGPGITTYPQWFSSGSGTFADPWIGWATGITWAAGRKYLFPEGFYSYATAPHWAQNRIDIEGQGNVYLIHTGAGYGIDLETQTGTHIFGVRLRNFRLIGNAATTLGMVVRHVHHSNIEDITILSMAAAGRAFYIQFTVANEYRRLTASDSNLDPYLGTMPADGIYLEVDGPSENPTDNTFITPRLEGLSGVGINIQHGNSNTFIGGTSEDCGNGVLIANGSQYNVFINLYCEINATYDVHITDGNNNYFYSTYNNAGGGAPGVGWISIDAGEGNAIWGGMASLITIGAPAKFTTVMGVMTASIADNSTSSTLLNNYNGATMAALENKLYRAFTQEVWAAPALQNGWVDQGAGTSPSGYYRDTLGIVHLRGHIITGTFADGTLLFTLPVGYRPSYTMELHSSSHTIVLLIATTGTVLIYGATGALVCMDGMLFETF